MIMIAQKTMPEIQPTLVCTGSGIVLGSGCGDECSSFAGPVDCAGTSTGKKTIGIFKGFYCHYIMCFKSYVQGRQWPLQMRTALLEISCVLG